MTIDVAIVGGGVSGLAAAFELTRYGRRVILLERQQTVGGNAVSERLNGFLMEHGPSTISAQSRAANRISSALGLDDERCELGAGVKRRYLVRDGHLRGIATHPFGFVASNYLSAQSRLRLLLEWRVPPREGEGHEETIAAFSRRRFGKEFADRVMDPLVGGLYAGRADELSVEAVFPGLVALERTHGSVTRGVLKSRLANRRMPGSRLFSWRHGVGSLPAGLRRCLDGRIRTGVTVRGIKVAPDGLQIDAGVSGQILARTVLIAAQPHIAAQLLEPVDGDAATAAGDIAAPPLAVVFLGYPRSRVAHPLDGLGFLTALSEGRRLTGAQFCSTMFPARAPEGHVAVAAYFGGARDPDLARRPADELNDLARAEFGELIGAKGEPVVARVRHWPLGIPQYRLGHLGRVARLRGLSDRVPGLYVTGNYFSGPSVAECLTRARETAVAMNAYLADSHAPSRRAAANISAQLGV